MTHPESYLSLFGKFLRSDYIDEETRVFVFCVSSLLSLTHISLDFDGKPVFKDSHLFKIQVFSSSCKSIIGKQKQLLILFEAILLVYPANTYLCDN